MNKKWMPITAGVLDIINGVAGIVVGLYGFINQMINPPIYKDWYEDWIALTLFIAGIMAIIGGIGVIKKKRLSLALVGAIGGFISTSWWLGIFPQIINYGLSLDILLGVLLGIPAIVAIIFTILSRKQFEK